MQAINVGAAHFAQALEAQGATVQPVDWQPPCAGDERLAARLAALWSPQVEAANALALRRLLDARPVAVDIRPAREVVPDLTPETVLHAGPPIAWERMCGPLRGAIVGALLYEGLAGDEAEAVRLAERGAVRFDSCHHHRTVGPMAGVTTASMPVWVVEERAGGGVAFSNLNEGLGKVLRHGANAPAILARLRWLNTVVGPALGAALRRLGGLDVRALLAEAVQMGDEGHNRHRAGTAIFIRTIAPALVALDLPSSDQTAILQFLADNPVWTLNVVMAACKAACDAAAGVPAATLVTTMARNGTDFGVRVSGLPDQWFTAPAEMPVGLMFPGFQPEDGNPDIGDSAITETAGLGGFAMAGAPAIVQFVGGTVADAMSYTREMYEITLAESPIYQLPTLGFRGTPTGIDVRLVAQTGIRPLINTGIAGRVAGTGQVGAGIVRAPWPCFTQAVDALASAVTVA